MILAALLAAATSAARPDWQVLARCAAAYEVNAQVADPDRPSSMKAMVSDVANDYRRAAETRYRRTAKASTVSAQRAVSDEVKRVANTFWPKPRTEVEAVIDACPQPG